MTKFHLYRVGAAVSTMVTLVVASGAANKF